MEWKFELKERENKKNNILIRGLDIGTYGIQIQEKVEEFLKGKLQVETEVKKVRVMGRRKIVQVQLKDWKDKKEIIRKKKNLGEERIFIEHDRTKRKREAQKRIVNIANKGREIMIRYMKIKIDNTWHSWNEINQKLERMENFR